MGLWRARCLAIGTPGSEVRAGETDRLRGRHRAPAKPIWYVLEERGFQLLLVNARHVKILPGRKTDVGDAAWLCELLECGLLRGSFVPPPAIRQLRDLTRYRKRPLPGPQRRVPADPKDPGGRRHQAGLGRH